MALKKVTAIFDELRLKEVEQALVSHGISGFTVRTVKGRGCYFDAFNENHLTRHIQMDVYTSAEHARAIALLIVNMAHKQRFGTAPAYQSCHTAVAEGYVFEGHIPAHIIDRFLAEKPEGAIGLAVPGMPVGSPGMEMGDRHDDYDVLLLKKDGGSEIYADIGGNVQAQN